MSEDKKVPNEVLTMIDLVVNEWDSFTVEVVQSEGSGKSKAWTYGTLTLTETNRPDLESYKIDIAWDENENVEFDYYDGNWESISELPMHLYFIARQAQIRQGRAASDLFDECQRLKKAAIQPEWRPLSVLTRHIAEQWKTWVFRPMTKTGEEQSPMFVHISVWAPPDEELQSEAECRPVDSEGIPVPWAKVGL